MRLVIYLVKMIVVGFLLTTIVNCSSIKKSKTTSKEVIAVKKQETERSLSAKQSDSSYSNDYRSEINSKIHSNVLGIEYTPTFDEKGILIPFTYTGTDGKGNKTTVDIVGPAKVTNTIIDRDEATINSIMESRAARIAVVDSMLNELQVQIDSNIKKEDATKTKQPDYIKYIIWMGFSILVLAILLVVGFLYLKATVSKYKNLLP